MTFQPALYSCIILAGGEGKRVAGRDKGLVLYQNKPLIAHVLSSLKNQTSGAQIDDIVISANRNLDSYRQYSTCIVSDIHNDSDNSYRGPLAGIAACLPYCKHETVVVVACDMPHLPANLIVRLAEDLKGNSVCVATVDNHHQLAMLVKKDMSESIRQNLDNNQLKLIQWIKSVPHKTVSFDDMPDAFANLNRL